MPETTEATFSGSIPESYDKYLGPLLMEPYGKDLVKRLPINGLRDVLELACGTGVVTQLLRERLGESTRLVATDLSEGMLKVGQSKTMSKPVEWKVADATELPFPDASFDMVVSQFGVMFFPDKDKAMREVFRVLRPGGRVLFNVWDKIEFNDFPRVTNDVLTGMFKEGPPEFYTIPFGFHDHLAIRTMLRNAGFFDIALSTIELKVQADPLHAAKGLVEGNPISDEIKTKLGIDVREATERVERAIAGEFGQKMSKGGARAIVIGARKAGDLSTSDATQKKEPSATAKAKKSVTPKAPKS